MLDLVRNFAGLRNLLVSRDSSGLKAFGAQRAKDALEFSDASLAKFSVVGYALSKLIDKPYIYESRRWKRFALLLEQLLAQGEKCRDTEKCHDVLGQIIHEMHLLSSDLGQFVMTAVEKAKIKAATQVYAHGASVGRAIELTGADRKELLSYLGATRLPEKYETRSIGQRVAFAEKLFR